MARLPRRNFLYLCVGGATLAFGCTDTSSDDGSETENETESGPEDGGETGGEIGDACGVADAAVSLGLVPFLGEGDAAVGQIEGEGLDGRLALDLSGLDETALITANEDFFIRTLAPDQLVPDQPWSVALEGLVASETSLSLADLEALPQHDRVVLLECSGNGGGRAFGLISAAQWSGPLLSDVLDQVEVLAEATAVRVAGFDEHSMASEHSTPGCAWVFRLEELAAAGAMLALRMNGEALPLDHGAPVRLIVPGWYGCCNPKWVDSIRLVDASEPATSQMIEFASRTHQSAAHELAADYAPAIMQQAAMPVRVEAWEIEGERVYEIVGILWGGTELSDALAIRFNDGPATPVELCEPHASNDTWTLWRYLWQPSGSGEYLITLVIDDPAVPTVRLDSGFYARSVVIES